MVAVSLALQAPDLVRSLVLLSGYYFPKARLDAVLNASLAFPVIGDALRYTISPFAGLSHAAFRHSGHVRVSLCAGAL
jgi:pimeloyl-ACP methyl ester carboxylesterase